MDHLGSETGIVQPHAERLRFGEVAVALGYVTDLDVQAALAVQRLEDRAGKPRRLVGEILVAQGRLSRVHVSQVLDALVASAHGRRAQPTARLGWCTDSPGPLVA